MRNQPTLRLVVDNPGRVSARSSSMEIPVTSDKTTKLAAVGLLSPCSQPQTVGCFTPMRSASAAWVKPESSRNFLSRSIVPLSIGDSYSPSIGQTYGAATQTIDMAKSETFWDRVVEALSDMGVNEDQQTAVAKMIGAKQPSIWEWANEDSLPSMKNARALARKLGVSVDWLLMGDTAKVPPPKGDAWADALWRLWPNLTDEEKARVVGNVAAGAPLAKKRGSS